MIKQDTDEIEIDIADAKKAIELSEAMVRLEKNTDFKKVFTDHYCKDFAITNVLMRGGLGFRMNEKYMEANLRKLDSIGEFAEFIRNIKAHGQQMQQLLQEAKAIQDEPVDDSYLEM